MENQISEHIADLTTEILNDYKNDRIIDRMDVFSQPVKEEIIEMTDKLFRIVFPGYFRNRNYKLYHVESSITVLIEDVAYNLNKQVALALRKDMKYAKATEEAVQQAAQEVTVEFLSRIPRIREYIDTDVRATLDGDPAAENSEVIILSYPGLRAIATYRIAHELYLLQVPILPRIMSEYAHSRTGIDINPGATIGHYFFIDHGTGIVIGETTTIGDHVKVYQGVTLGALSTRGGRALCNTKRHPTIEDNVCIYSNASILGGDTVIGHDSVIGGNVFITESVEPYSTVHAQFESVCMSHSGESKS